MSKFMRPASCLIRRNLFSTSDNFSAHWTTPPAHSKLKDVALDTSRRHPDAKTYWVIIPKIMCLTGFFKSIDRPLRYRPLRHYNNLSIILNNITMTSHLRNIKTCQNTMIIKKYIFFMYFKINCHLKECQDINKSHTGGVGVAGSNPVVPTN